MAALFAVYGFLHILPAALRLPDLSVEFLTLGLEVLFWGLLLRQIARRGLLIKYRIGIKFDLRWENTVLWLIPVIRWWINGVQMLSLTALFSLIIAAFSEELVFRSWIPVKLQKSRGTSPISAAAVSSVLFALFHFAAQPLHTAITVLHFIFTGSAGFALCCMAENDGSILQSTILHILINITATGIPSQTQASVLETAVSTGCFLCYGMVQTYRYRKKVHESHETLH